jgi:hypothetical protein
VAETFGSLIDTVISQLQGFVTDAPMFGQVVNSVTANDTEIKIQVPSQCQPTGVIEIDEELIYVLSWDAVNSVVSVPAWGRGQQGTTPAPHASGAKVSINPRYPRRRVGQAINNTIQAMCPPLFGVTTGTLTAQPLQWEYPLPAHTRSLIRVEYLPWQAAQYDWRPLREARIKRDTGVPVLHLNTRAGFLSSAIRYTVATDPVELTDPAQPFTDCGLLTSTIDVVQLGTIPRLVTTTELARQQYNSVESSERVTLLPTGSGTNPAKFYYAMFADRLKAEADGLRQMYPLTMKRNS